MGAVDTDSAGDDSASLDEQSGDGAVGSALFSTLGRASFLLDAVQTSCLAPFELNFVDYSALRILDRAGEPYQLSPSRMAEVLVRTTGGMTRVVDRLETRGLVERGRGGPDRRVVLVGLTDRGLQVAREARDAYHARRAEVLTGLSGTELDQIESSLLALVTALERDRTQHTR